MTAAWAVSLLAATGAMGCGPLPFQQPHRTARIAVKDAFVEGCLANFDYHLMGIDLARRNSPPAWGLANGYEEAERAIDVRTGAWLEPRWTSLRDAAFGWMPEARCCGANVVYRQGDDHPEVVMRVTYAHGAVTRNRVEFLGRSEASPHPRETEVSCGWDGHLAIASVEEEPRDQCSEEGRRVHAWLWGRDAASPEYKGHRNLSARCPGDIEKMTIRGRRLHVLFGSIRARAEGRPCDELQFALE